MRFLILLLLFLSACSPSNFHKRTIDDPLRKRSIEFGVWLPAASDEKIPLILLSHGSGGDYSNQQWLTDALVKQGYMVAAPRHPHNTTGDNDNVGVVSVWERPADMSLLLDYLIDESDWSGIIDIDRVGAVGFSSGGYTVIALAGAIYDREQIKAFCSTSVFRPECQLATDFSSVDYSRSALSYKDERIKAVFAMAPSVGAAMTQQSLEHISVPVSIVASEDDEVVDITHGALRYGQYIPAAALELLPSGGHFVFLRCNLVVSIADRFVEEFDICGREIDIDRKKIQTKVADKVVNFFKSQIG